MVPVYKITRKRKYASAFIVLLMVDEKRPNHLERSIWIREWLKERREKDAFHTLFQELAAYDEDGFQAYMRMNSETFKTLLGEIEPFLYPSKVCL